MCCTLLVNVLDTDVRQPANSDESVGGSMATVVWRQWVIYHWLWSMHWLPSLLLWLCRSADRSGILPVKWLDSRYLQRFSFLFRADEGWKSRSQPAAPGSSGKQRCMLSTSITLLCAGVLTSAYCCDCQPGWDGCMRKHVCHWFQSTEAFQSKWCMFLFLRLRVVQFLLFSFVHSMLMTALIPCTVS